MPVTRKHLQRSKSPAVCMIILRSLLTLIVSIDGMVKVIDEATRESVGGKHYRL
jgi:hypothetical protein